MNANGTRVLVVDDEPEIVRGLRIVLRNAGYAVEAASTKAEALASVATRPPEALVLDLVLPDGDGVSVCKERPAVEPASDPGPVGRRRRAREGPSAGRGRRRLRHEAVRDRGAAGAAARRPPPLTGLRTVLAGRDRRADDRPRRQTGRLGGPGGTPHADRIRPAPDPRAAPRPARHPSPAPPGGLGTPVHGGIALPARPHRPRPREARADHLSAALPDHGARGRLPVAGRVDLIGAG